jgi:phage tail protein X
MDENVIYYITKKGDTFDSIAFNFYTEEKLSSTIIAANRQYSDVLIFDSGVELIIPVIEENDDTPASLPPWER